MLARMSKKALALLMVFCMVAVSYTHLQHPLLGQQGGVGLGVHLQGGLHGRAAGGGADQLQHPLTEGGNVLFQNGEPGGQLMAAEALQQVTALLQGGEQVEAAEGPAGALSLIHI